MAAGNTSLTNWQITGNGVDFIRTHWQDSHLTRSIDLNRNTLGGIRQTFATNIGWTYEVKFDMAGNPDSNSAANRFKRIDVSTNGINTVQYTFDVQGKTRANMGWVTKIYTFVANSTSTTLAFTSVAPASGFGAALDNVRVTAVPEPTSIGLFGLGGIAVLGLVRRVRSRK